MDLPSRSKPKVTSTQSLLAATTLPSASTAAAKKVVASLLEPLASAVASAVVWVVETPSFKVSFYQMGKMDTSNLTERYFDENTILYSVSNRNEIVFGEKPDGAEKKKEETITFVPGPGVEAIIHGQNEKTGVSEGVAADEQALVALWRAFKESNPEGTLDDFRKNVSTSNDEVQ